MWLEARGKIRTQTTTRRLSLQGWSLGVDMTVLHLPWWRILFASGLYLWYPRSSCSASVRDFGLDGPVPSWDLQCKAGIERRWRPETLQRNHAGRKCQLHQHFFFFLTRLSILESKRAQLVSHLVISKISCIIRPYQQIANVNTVHAGSSSSSQYL